MSKIILLVYGLLGLALIYMLSKVLNFDFTSSNNSIYKGANKLLTGDEEFGIGAKIYEAINPNKVKTTFTKEELASSKALEVEDRRFTPPLLSPGPPLKSMSSGDLIMTSPLLNKSGEDFYRGLLH